MLSGDEFYDDEVTSGLDPSYPNKRSGAEPSGVSGNRSADAPPPTSSDGGSPETERAMFNVDSPDRSHLFEAIVEAVEKALLYTFQLSNKDYRAMQTAFSEGAFIRALEQDGYTVAALPAPPLAEAVERIRAHHDRTLGHSPTNKLGYCARPDGISATYCETGILLKAIR